MGLTTISRGDERVGKLERWSKLWRGTMQSLFWCTILAVLIVNGVFSTIPQIFANVPEPGGDTTVVSPSGGAVSINEDTPQPESANIRLVIPTLSDSGGGTPINIRIISVTGGTLWSGAGAAITLGASGTLLSITSGYVDLRFAPTANRDTAATFQYVVVDPHNSSVNSSESTATINITPVNDPPVLSTSSGDNGDGLYGTYYLNQWDLSGSSTSRVDATVNFSSAVEFVTTTVWGITSVNSDQFSVRWTGKVKAPATGNYIFRTYTDDGVRLWVNGNLVIDKWILQAPTYWTSGSISLTAQTQYDIRLEFYERGGGELVQLDWYRPDLGYYETIPQAYLFPGTTRPTLSYVKNSGAVAVDDGVVIADIDSTTMASASVAISANYQSTEDSLGFVDQNGITGSFNGTTGILSLTGSASLAHYQAALQSVTYTNSSATPNSATRTVAFTINDGTSDSNATTRSIAIDATNDPPVITGGASVNVAMDEDATPTPFSLTLGASDPENGTMTWSISGAASHGAASVSGIGNSKAVSYSPAANYNGSDSFIVQVEDSLGATDTITVNVTVNPRNDPPVNTVVPSISGTFHPGQTLTANNGTWNDSIDQTPGTITYAYQWRRFNDNVGNGLSVVGTSSTYMIQSGDLNKYLVLRVTATDNGEGLPASQSVTHDTDYHVISNAAPVIAGGDTIAQTIDEDGAPTAFAQTLSASDEDGDMLTWSISTPASHGAAAVSGSGDTKTINYEPTENYNGNDSFVVMVEDAYGGSDMVTINLTINPGNDAPQVTAMPSINQPLGVTRVDHVLTVSNGTWNDDDDLVPGTIGFAYQWQRCSAIACADAANIASATAASYTLKNADYGKYIRVKVIVTDDGEGSPEAQSVTVYTAPIGQIMAADSTITISSGQQYTNSSTVLLDLLVNNILNGATEMSFSEDPLFASANWVPFSLSASYQLSAGDGQKILYVRFKDADGNVSESHSNTILLDTIAELSVARIDQTATSNTLSSVTTNSTKPVFAGTTEPGATVTITIHSDPITGNTTADSEGNWSWTPVQDLPYGTHQAIVLARDAAGNTTETTFQLLVTSAQATATSSIASTAPTSTTPTSTPRSSGLRITRSSTPADSSTEPTPDTTISTPSTSITNTTPPAVTASDISNIPEVEDTVTATAKGNRTWLYGLIALVLVLIAGSYYRYKRRTSTYNDLALPSNPL